MLETWNSDIESLEAISQDAEARAIFLRMAELSRAGRLGAFLTALARDDDIDEETKRRLAELARDDTFLHVVEDYVERTRALH
jgi:hypothetical protein